MHNDNGKSGVFVAGIAPGFFPPPDDIPAVGHPLKKIDSPQTSSTVVLWTVQALKFTHENIIMLAVDTKNEFTAHSCMLYFILNRRFCQPKAAGARHRTLRCKVI